LPNGQAQWSSGNKALGQSEGSQEIEQDLTYNRTATARECARALPGSLLFVNIIDVTYYDMNGDFILIDTWFAVNRHLRDAVGSSVLGPAADCRIVKAFFPVSATE
jgi:hypothetical protein